jgi:hypothetical protein
LIRWRLIVLALTVFAGTALTACQSSQDKAKQIQEQAQAAAPKPLVISKPSKDVKVTDTALLHDQNGDAVVVEVKNDSNKTLVNVPILVDIRDGKKTVYKNDTAGLDFALNHIAVLQPHETFDWVNDQVTAEGKTVKATVGDPEAKPPAGPLPKIDVSPPRAGSDFSGPKVSGEVTSDSKNIEQQRLILFAVARQGGRIVAAGRGQIKALKTGAKPAPYVIYFIGNPVGADVTIQAPPTVLQ